MNTHYLMDQRIPKHHAKQEICATRPSYREGKIPKAVKVYTINNESKYILIQGVPSVGAQEELIKLCSSYGQIEENHALDEYPCEDKYTEVHLLKYKKIQSARFAKRKLDDYSFFGSNLHVCYAPEYETVAETREKLQDRRRIIAFKIRHHKNEQKDTKVTDCNTSSTSSTWEKEIDDDTILQSSTLRGFQYIPDDDKLLSHSQFASQQLNNESDDISLNNSHGPFCFVLPLPPKHSDIKNVETKSNYEFFRVPSKHSTLPANYDGRLKQHDQQEEKDRLVSAEQCQPMNISETNISKEAVKIKKGYTPQKQTLRFVPRQAVKRKPNESESNDGTNVSASDEIDKKIRKSAFILGDQQGPSEFPGRRDEKPDITPEASMSYNNTIKTIRSKISQVITRSLMPKN